MAPYCSNRNTNCYCQNGNYRPQTRQENERQLHCNIPVPPLPEQKSKNYCCDECVGDYSKTDVLQEFPVIMLNALKLQIMANQSRTLQVVTTC